MTCLQVKTPAIDRNPELASKTPFELIVVGGGIYGVMILLEATRRNIKTLLIEKNDFGSGTSFNWLHILHGGFRYLQKANLKRFYESVAERSWFLRTFPRLVQPLPCLMPLYGKGLRRPAVLRLAVLINDLLSFHRNQGIAPEKKIADGFVISPQKTLELAPNIVADGLKGGVIWYDAFLPESQILIKEILRWCVGKGAMVLNYIAARRILSRDGHVAGIEGDDLNSDKSFEFHSSKVVNAAGPWCRIVAAGFDRDHPSLFSYSKAWNVLFHRPFPLQIGLAVAPDLPSAHTYFLLPWKGSLMAGTGHGLCQSPEQRGRPTIREMNRFISDINMAVPGLKLREIDIKRVFHGVLPSVRQGSVRLADRAVLIDHEKKRGPRGLFSVSGVKFTTARQVAEHTICKLFPDVPRPALFNHNALDEAIRLSLEYSLFEKTGAETEVNDDILINRLKHIFQSESVVHLQDLVFRRTNLWENPALAFKFCNLLGSTLQMDKNFFKNEIQIIKGLFKGESSL